MIAAELCNATNLYPKCDARLSHLIMMPHLSANSISYRVGLYVDNMLTRQHVGSIPHNCSCTSILQNLGSHLDFPLNFAQAIYVFWLTSVIHRKGFSTKGRFRLRWTAPVKNFRGMEQYDCLRNGLFTTLTRICSVWFYLLLLPPYLAQH